VSTSASDGGGQIDCFQLNSGQSVYRVPIKFRLMEAPWKDPCLLIPKVLIYPPLTVVRMKTTQADFYDKEGEGTQTIQVDFSLEEAPHLFHEIAVEKERLKKEEGYLKRAN
jgi:hypothetical protein